jgi:tetratricopeptide (TPR) repeat protein
MRIRGLLVAGVLAWAQASTGVAQPVIEPPPAPADAETDAAAQPARTALPVAFAQLREREFAAARRSFQAIIESPGFDALDESQQYEVLSLAGGLAHDLGDPAHAHPLLVRASGYPQVEGGVWYARLKASAALGDDADAARCITMLARRWPAIMRELDERAIQRLATRLEQQAAATNEHRELLDALFDTGFTVGGEPPDALWLSLVRLALEQDHVARARAVARKIGSPSSILAMHVDRRFDRVVDSAERFQLRAAVEADIERIRALVESEPTRLSHRVMLQRRLLDDGRDAAALADVDAVIARITEAEGARYYVDFDDEYPWILDQRAEALWGLDRWEEAIVQLRRAARRPEEGGMNVSQALNLGWYYADLGEADKALEAVEDLGETSPYGRMRLEMLYLMVAVQREDASAVERHLAFMRDHREDAIATYQLALMHAGRVDEAAAVLIERLRNPEWRSDALIEVQPSKAVEKPPSRAARDKRSKAVIARPEVQAVIAEVGYLRPPSTTAAPAS